MSKLSQVPEQGKSTHSGSLVAARQGTFNLYQDKHPSRPIFSQLPPLPVSNFYHFLNLYQDFELIGRGKPPGLLCAVFLDAPQHLSRHLFSRCFARTAFALAPNAAQANAATTTTRTTTTTTTTNHTNHTNQSNPTEDTTTSHNTVREPGELGADPTATHDTARELGDSEAGPSDPPADPSAAPFEPGPPAPPATPRADVSAAPFEAGPPASPAAPPTALPEAPSAALSAAPFEAGPPDPVRQLEWLMARVRDQGRQVRLAGS